MSWLSKLTSGLSKTSDNISSGISDIFTKRQLDGAMLEELEELLIMADMGATTAAKIVSSFGEGRFDKAISDSEVKTALAAEIASILEPVATPLSTTDASPHVVLVVGVNGTGKTTTIGKLAAQFKGQGKKVMLGAADTFRAAAVEQLAVWAERVGCSLIKGEEGADPASVAYRALEQATSEQADILFIDTAGRLHNKANLMAELSKIRNVLHKLDASAPHSVVIVLDATTGQNAMQQLQAFKELVDVTGMVITKLDGTAKAGIAVALADTHGLSIHAVGVGEGIDDLQPFDAQQFAQRLVG